MTTTGIPAIRSRKRKAAQRSATAAASVKAAKLKCGSKATTCAASLYERLPIELRVQVMRHLNLRDVLTLQEALDDRLPELAAIERLENANIYSWPGVVCDADTIFDPALLKDWYWMYSDRLKWIFSGFRNIDVIAHVPHDISLLLSDPDQDEDSSTVQREKVQALARAIGTPGNRIV